MSAKVEKSGAVSDGARGMAALTPKDSLVQITVSVFKSQSAFIDAAVKKTGRTRNEVVRHLLGLGIKAELADPSNNDGRQGK